jgi:hypothetical protein
MMLDEVNAGALKNPSGTIGSDWRLSHRMKSATKTTAAPRNASV